MFKNIRYIQNDFLDEKERNKIIVDSMLHKRYTFPPKSSIGKEIKHVAKLANKYNDWHFHLDRIESIKVYSFNNKTKDTDVYRTYWNEPTNTGIQQKQRKLICICKLNADVENLSGGNIILKDFNDYEYRVSEEMMPGDLLIFPSFMPFRVTSLPEEGERATYLEAIIRGLSFR